MTLWHVNSAPALKYNGYRLKLGWQGTKRKSVHTGGGDLVCECMRKCTGWRGAHWGAKFLIIKIGRSEMTKSHMFNTSLQLTNHKITHSKIAFQGKMSLMSK